MNVLLSLLQKSTDYNQLLKAVEAKQAVAVSGLSQAPRSHVLAAAHEQSGRPLVAVCQDDMAAKRLASELGAFLGEEPPVLPSRELTLAGAIGVSRQWEQQRLRLLYALAQDTLQPMRNIWPGTLFSLAAWMVVSGLYSYYANHFSHYSLLYGSIGAIIVVLIWLNLTAVTLILGAEVNGVLISMRKDRLTEQ